MTPPQSPIAPTIIRGPLCGGLSQPLDGEPLGPSLGRLARPHPVRLERTLRRRSCELAKPRRPVVMGLSSAAVALIVIGVAAVALNSGFSGGTAASNDSGTGLPASGTTRPSAAAPRASRRL